MKKITFEESTYWNENGVFQPEYEEMMKAKKEGKYTFTKAFIVMANRYYRYFNDGANPYKKIYNRDDIEEALEADMDNRICAEYKRFTKTMSK